MGRHLPRKAQRRGANCAVSGGDTALNRITDVMRVASPRITQRLCAIGPPRGQAERKATRDAARGREGAGPPAGGPVTRQAQAPAAARSSSRATARPRRSVPGFPRRRSCRARPPSRAGLCVAQRPPPLSALHGPGFARHRSGWPRSSGASAGVSGIFGRRRATLQARPGLLQRRAAPLAGPRPRPSRPASGRSGPRRLRRRGPDHPAHAGARYSKAHRVTGPVGLRSASTMGPKSNAGEDNPAMAYDMSAERRAISA